MQQAHVQISPASDSCVIPPQWHDRKTSGLNRLSCTVDSGWAAVLLCLLSGPDVTMQPSRYSQLSWNSAAGSWNHNSPSAICHRPRTSNSTRATHPRSACASHLFRLPLPSWPTKAQQWEVLCVQLLPWDRLIKLGVLPSLVIIPPPLLPKNNSY